jgi:hypothetical protein
VAIPAEVLSTFNGTIGCEDGLLDVECGNAGEVLDMIAWPFLPARTPGRRFRAGAVSETSGAGLGRRLELWGDNGGGNIDVSPS